MIYRGPGSFQLAPCPTPSCVSPAELADRRGREEKAMGKGVKAYDGEKVWTSINHSILSVKRDHREVKRSAGHVVFVLFILRSGWFMNTHK